MAITGNGRCYSCQNWNVAHFNKSGNPKEYWASCRLENGPVKNKNTGLTFWTDTCGSFLKVTDKMKAKRKESKKFIKIDVAALQ